jgi:hypothetical protein
MSILSYLTPIIPGLIVYIVLQRIYHKREVATLQEHLDYYIKEYNKTKTLNN